ncbi:MAG: helix-turn-helix domain-containing protein [Acidiferrobacter sp.]
MTDSLAKILSSRRKAINLTQGNLARMAQVSRPTIVALEQGRSLQMDVLARILAALGMTLTAEITQMNQVAPHRPGRPLRDLPVPGQRFPNIDQLMRKARVYYA